MRRFFISAVAITVATLAVACGGGGGSDESTGAPSGGAASAAAQTEVEIDATNLKFDTTSLSLPAKADVTVSLRNGDAGVMHNVSIYKKSDGTGKVFTGDLFNGVATKEYRFKTPEKGTYYFRCDAHPDMAGTVRVN